MNQVTSKTHDVGAFALLLTTTVFFSPSKLNTATMIVALIANIVGALLPDLDQSGNRLWDLLPGGNFIGRVLKNIFISHRTLSHSFLGIFIVYQTSFWLIPKLFNASFVNPTIIIYSLLIGYISHLLLDFITEEGIPLLFPFKWKFGFPPIKPLRIKTDHWFEKLIIFPGLIFYIVWITLTNYQLLFSLLR